MGAGRLMANLRFKKVVLDTRAHCHAFTQRILNRLSNPPVQHLDSAADEQPPALHRAAGYQTEMGKDTLHLLPFKGNFLKPCPGTKAYICCGYQILNVATQCPLDCSYCILQSYFDQPNLRVFVNLENELDRVCKRIDDTPDQVFRVGTGEFTDSLALDSITGWSDLLLPRFSKRKNAVLELKTKTASVDRLLASKHRDRIIVSWSLNSPYIATREEHRAASLKRRLEAAGRCQSDGFVLGFHFDPLIPHPRWEEGYLETLELLDKYIDPRGIIWVSLGSFRFMRQLKPIIRRRHPDSCVLDGEFIQGLDGKMRYFKPIRMELYAFMRQNLEKWSKDLGLYLCMESSDVWEHSMGWSPNNSDGLRHYLDERVKEIFGSNP